MTDALAGGLIGGGAMLVGGLVILWLAGRMADRRFTRNKWAGIRTPATMKSDEAWFAAHELAAPWMSAAGTSAMYRFNASRSVELRFCNPSRYRYRVPLRLSMTSTFWYGELTLNSTYAPRI